MLTFEIYGLFLFFLTVVFVLTVTLSKTGYHSEFLKTILWVLFFIQGALTFDIGEYNCEYLLTSSSEVHAESIAPTSLNSTTNITYTNSQTCTSNYPISESLRAGLAAIFIGCGFAFWALKFDNENAKILR